MLLGNKIADMLNSKYLYTPMSGVEQNKSDMPHEDWIDLQAHYSTMDGLCCVPLCVE